MYVIDEEINNICSDQSLSVEEKDKAEKRLSYQEFEFVEKLEYIRKKIN